LHIPTERVNSDHTSGSDPDFSQFPQDFVHIDASGLFTELVASVWSASTSPRSRTLTWILHDTGSDRLGITAIYLFESPSSVGKIKVGGIDLNKARMRWVAEALIALCVSPSESQGFTASELARQVRLLSNQSESEYGPRRAAYDLKKLRAKNIVQRIGQTRRYQSTPSGLRAMVALVVLRNKAIKPLLAAAHRRRKSRGAQNPRPIDKHYETIRTAMQGVFDELGLAA